jgi:hypothetical protein
MVKSGVVRRQDTVVAVITGSGFRQMGVLPKSRRIRLAADAGPEALERALRHAPSHAS